MIRYLATTALKAVEATDVAGRLEAVERMLKLRNESEAWQEGNIEKHYGALTAAERATLCLEAMTGGDPTDLDRLLDGCPRGTLRMKKRTLLLMRDAFSRHNGHDLISAAVTRSRWRHKMRLKNEAEASNEG